jgi:hypothetical protein
MPMGYLDGPIVYRICTLAPISQPNTALLFLDFDPSPVEDLRDLLTILYLYFKKGMVVLKRGEDGT